MLHSTDFDPHGFRWVNPEDADNSVLSYLRVGSGNDKLLVVCNFTPVTRHNYRVGIPEGGTWREVMNSDASLYGGSSQGNFGAVEATPIPPNGFAHSLTLLLPPLATIFLRKGR